MQSQQQPQDITQINFDMTTSYPSIFMCVNGIEIFFNEEHYKNLDHYTMTSEPNKFLQFEIGGRESDSTAMLNIPLTGDNEKYVEEIKKYVALCDASRVKEYSYDGHLNIVY